MADAPQFVPMFSGTVLYNMNVAGAVPGWIGYVYTAGIPGGTSPPPNLPPSIAIPASFMQGHYLFARVAPTLASGNAATAFAAAIQGWLNEKFGTFKVFSGTACVWLSNPNAVPVENPDNAAITMFNFGSPPVATGRNFTSSIGPLTLAVPGLSTQSQIDVSVTARGLRFGVNGPGRVNFTVRSGALAPQIANGANLPFVGAYAGAMVTTGTVARSGSPQAPSTVAFFQTGFHYLHGVVDDNGVAQPDLRQVYPVLSTVPDLNDLTYVGAFDPLDPVNSVTPLSSPADGRYRTQFALVGNGPIDSAYRDARGKPAALVSLGGADANGEPLPNTGALVFQPRGPAGTAPLGDVYMTLAGDFALDAAPAPGATDKAHLELLAGLFGSERFGLARYVSGQSFDRLRFQPGKAAYAPVFPFPPSDLNAARAPGPRLADTYVTAWAAPLDGPSTAVSYRAQPEGNTLYSPGPPAPPGRSRQPGVAAAVPAAVLSPFATPSALPQSPYELLPFVPYGELDDASTSFPADEVGAFESQILSSERQRLLAPKTQARVAAARRARHRALAGQGALPGSATQATTPQGLYAELATDTSAMATDPLYDLVVLARSIDKKAKLGTTDFGFANLQPQLQNLFQTNQLMAVIINPAPLGTTLDTAPAIDPRFSPAVVIADWRMTAAVGDPASTSAYSNILILKYCDGTLLERVQNPSKWVDPQTFSMNGSGDAAFALTSLSEYLKQYLQDAIDESKRGNTLYDNFARIVQDPNWNGFLVLRAKVDPSGFPDQIKGLVAGIDFTRFEAHHFGATVSRVSVSGTVVKMEVPSSLFGLIDYQLPAYQQNVGAGGNPDMPVPLPGSGDFGFVVLQLQALFENAGLTDFRSRIQLTMNTLFGSPIDTAFGAIGRLPATAVVLRGSFQRQGETSVYVFEQNATTMFTLKSDVLLAVPLVRVVFNTLSNGDDGTVRSRFLMWGAFEFALLSVDVPKQQGGGTRPADLLSFGQDANAPRLAPPRGLRFSGLDVSMSSPVTSPAAVTFVLETGRLALDIGASEARQHSVYTDLALEVDGFIAGAEDKRPIDFGYLPVSIEPKIKAISGPWYAVVYKVTLGGPGGLAGQVGFTSRLLVAWAPTSQPGDRTSSLFVGLQLPGAAPGAKLFSIQGVLKLTIDSLVLRREQVSGSDLSFVLRMNDIGLTFLGIAKLPPGASINFFLFGDPSGSGSLGWYAAYVAPDQQQVAAEERRALPSPAEHAGGGPRP